MGWGVGFDDNWQRDIGYGVPAYCDSPWCNEEIDRGLSYVCGSRPYGGDHGCGLYFCERHLEPVTRGRGKNAEHLLLCKRCATRKKPYNPKPDHPRWTEHKNTDPSWAEWRAEQLKISS